MTEQQKAKKNAVDDVRSNTQHVDEELGNKDFKIGKVADKLDGILFFYREKADPQTKVSFKREMGYLATKLSKKCPDKLHVETGKATKEEAESCQQYVYQLERPEIPIPSEAMIRYWKISAPTNESQIEKACLQDPAKPFTLKIQFYAEVDRPIAKKAFEVASLAGVTLLGIENSVETANKLGLEKPSFIPPHRFSWFAESDLARRCAEQLVKSMPEGDANTPNGEENTLHQIYLLPGSQRAVSNGLSLLIAKDERQPNEAKP
jgi:hypothetical protein